MFGFLRNEKFWLVAAGAVGTIIGGKILKSPTTSLPYRDLQKA